MSEIGEKLNFIRSTQRYLNHYQEDTKEEDKVRIEDPVYYVPHSDLKK